MDATELARIRSHPKFKQLERKRSRFGWSLAAIMLVIYMAFIVLVAFGHGVVASVTGPGPITLAFPLGLGVIVAAIALTGIYVLRANTEFDRLTQEILGEPPPPPRFTAALPAGAR